MDVQAQAVVDLLLAKAEESNCMGLSALQHTSPTQVFQLLVEKSLRIKHNSHLVKYLKSDSHCSISQVKFVLPFQIVYFTQAEYDWSKGGEWDRRMRNWGAFNAEELEGLDYSDIYAKQYCNLGHIEDVGLIAFAVQHRIIGGIDSTDIAQKHCLDVVMRMRYDTIEFSNACTSYPEAELMANSFERIAKNAAISMLEVHKDIIDQYWHFISKVFTKNGRLS